MNAPRVVAVSRDEMHRFSKKPVQAITLVAGIGVIGDAHAGTLVQHRSRVRRDPNQPNLRQVHLIHSELFAEAAARGYDVAAGELGENILTEGIDLLALPVDTRLAIGEVVIRITGLRNPCVQINDFRAGLLKVVLETADGADGSDGSVVRKAGVMAVVEHGGDVRPGQAITVTRPPLPHEPLQPV